MATITNLLAKYMPYPRKGHIKAKKHIVWYLKGTQHYDIAFHSDLNKNLQAFIKFPINTLTDFFTQNGVLPDQSGPKNQTLLILQNFSNHGHFPDS